MEAIIPVKPKVTVEGDRADNIMALTGHIHGYVPGDFVLWCFGFLPGSPQAQAYGCNTDRYLWVMAKENGEVIMPFKGTLAELLTKVKK